MKNKINEENIIRAAELLREYKNAKANLDKRIIENEEWWRLRFTQKESTTPSAWLFNSIINKHADAMDSIPTCACLPREKRDADSAKMLDCVLPCILETAKFEDTYSKCWYDKLKSGTACYGVFWNSKLEFGLGNIDIKQIDILNLFWEGGITDIQASRNLFHIEMFDTKELCEKYPAMTDKIRSSENEANEYLYDDNIDTSDKTAVIDWYYKKKNGTKTAVHLCKFTGNTLLYASENDEKFCEKGIYSHGKYPFIFDTLYPVKGSPCGFGIIDAMKGTQNDIDSLSSSIVKNAKMSSGRRFFVRSDGALNEKEFAEWDRPFVHYSGSGDPNSSIMPIEIPALPSICVSILNAKIDELKETSGNRDFSQGSVTGGVTAASAIAALQEAGSKTTRDVIASSYRAFEEICRLVIELIREFYTIPRSFRIAGDDGISFMNISSSSLIAPIYDIKVHAHKKSPFSRIGSNELALQLYNAGLFNAGNEKAAELCISMMDFEGKDKILSRLKAGGENNKYNI